MTADLWVNVFQFVMLIVALSIGIMRTISNKTREWLLLSMFYFSYALGDLYWLLMIFFIGDLPRYGHIAEMSWYASYLFLIMLLNQVKFHNEKYKNMLLLLIPVFTIGSCVFFMQWGDYLSNVICTVLATVIIWNAVKSLLYLKENKIKTSRAWVFRLAICFFVLEYAEWYSSCIWEAEDFSNPYYYFEILLTIFMLLFLHAVRKMDMSPIDENS